MKLNVYKFKIAQARACLTINELAKLSGLSRVGLSKIINGESNPTPKTIGLLAKALKVDVEEIVTIEE